MSSNSPKPDTYFGRCPHCNAVVESPIPPRMKRWGKALRRVRHATAVFDCSNCHEVIQAVYHSGNISVVSYTPADKDVVHKSGAFDVLRHLFKSAVEHLFPGRMSNDSDSSYRACPFEELFEDGGTSIKQVQQHITRFVCSSCGAQQSLWNTEAVNCVCPQCGSLMVPPDLVSIPETAIDHFRDLIAVDEYGPVCVLQPVSGADVEWFRVRLLMELTVADLEKT